MFLILTVATGACRSADDDDNNGTPDARPSTTADASGGTADAPISGGGATIKSINMGTEPAFRTPLTVEDVVVVGRSTSNSQGHIWVQDMGGGEYSGIHIFCSFTSTGSPCVHNRAFIEAIEIGDVVSITGIFSNNDFMGRPDDWEIIQPVITKKGTKATPTAITVPAAAVAKGMVGMADYKNKYNGTLVKVMGPISISKYQAPEYLGECNPVGLDGGMPRGDYYDNGFEAKAGDTTIMVGLGFYDSIEHCLPDCGFCDAEDLISEDDTFEFVQGVAYADRRNDLDYVEIRPVTPADLPKAE